MPFMEPHEPTSFGKVMRGIQEYRKTDMEKNTCVAKRACLITLIPKNIYKSNSLGRQN